MPLLNESIAHPVRHLFRAETLLGRGPTSTADIEMQRPSHERQLVLHLLIIRIVFAAQIGDAQASKLPLTELHKVLDDTEASAVGEEGEMSGWMRVSSLFQMSWGVLLILYPHQGAYQPPDVEEQGLKRS